jgi:Carbamoyl-phosphate synthase L chain, ATP binding domain
VLMSSAPSASVDELVSALESGRESGEAGMRFPLFVKAVAGGGRRGMRRVSDIAALPEAIEAASREAESAFGDPTVYLEQAVLKPRHIEVQILADNHGNVPAISIQMAPMWDPPPVGALTQITAGLGWRADQSDRSGFPRSSGSGQRGRLPRVPGG